MRIIAKFEKKEAARYVSHLDVQRLFQRAMHRAGLPMAYSQGFNPHPLVSFATALAVGYTSSSEWVDVKLAKDVDAEYFKSALNDALPCGFRVVEARKTEDNAKSLTSLMQAADYTVLVSEDMNRALDALMSGQITVTKKTKGGMKEIDIRPDVIDIKTNGNMINITGRLDAAGSLNIELFMRALKEKSGMDFEYRVHRNNIIFSSDEAEG